MKKIIASFLLAFFVMAASAQQVSADKTTVKPVTPPGPSPIKTKQDSLSYSIGVQVANFFKTSGVDKLNLQLLYRALNDVYQNKPLLIPVEPANKCVQDKMTYLNQLKMQQQQKENAAKVAPEKAKGAKFLAENKTKEGVIELPSGLQYKVLTMGIGAKPIDGQNVKVHYHGTLIDGTVFDSSVDRGQPLTLNVNGVIAGWTEALKMMPVGSKWKIFLPSNLAYGDGGAPPTRKVSLKPGCDSSSPRFAAVAACWLAVTTMPFSA